MQHSRAARRAAQGDACARPCARTVSPSLTASTTRVQPSSSALAWTAPPSVPPLSHQQQEHDAGEPLILSSNPLRPATVVLDGDDCNVSSGEVHHLHHHQQHILLHSPGPELPVDVPAMHTIELAPASVAEAGDSGETSGLAHLLGRDLGIPRDRMQQILLRWPSVEQLDIEYISMSVHNLAAFLRCKPAQAAVAVARDHRLLHASLPTLQQQAGTLCSCLQVPPHVVLRIAQQAPAVLFEQPQDLLRQAEAVANAMQLTVQQVAEAAQEEPWLLRAPPSKIRSRVQQLGQLLGLPAGTPQLMQPLLSHPRLVCMSPEDIEQKLQHMATCLQLSPGAVRQLVLRYPDLLNFSPQRLDTHIGLLCQHVPLLQLQHMVQQEPSLLARNARRIARALHHLQQLLACSKERVLQLVARRPCLLIRSQASLRSSYKALSIWKLSAEDKRELILAQPLLLRLSGQEVHGRCRWLRNLMLSNPYFHGALRRMPLKLLGLVIMHLPHAWSRLQYLAESSQEAGTDIMAVVQAHLTEFMRAHPGYRRWLMWKCAQQGCPIPWRSAVFHHQQPHTWQRRPPAGSPPTQAAAAVAAAAAAGAVAAAAGPAGPWRTGPEGAPAPPPHQSWQQPEAWHPQPGGAEPSHRAQGPAAAPARAHQPNGSHQPSRTFQQAGPAQEAAAAGQPRASTPSGVRVHEARTLLIGGQFVRKPRRVVRQSQHRQEGAADSSSSNAQ